MFSRRKMLRAYNYFVFVAKFDFFRYCYFYTVLNGIFIFFLLQSIEIIEILVFIIEMIFTEIYKGLCQTPYMDYEPSKY